MYGCSKDCIPFRLPQISCFTLSLKCFSSDSDNCPNVGIGPLLQFPDLPRAGPVLLTLLFFSLVPWSYWVLRGSIYSFPLVSYFCPISAGVLHALLCLKVYSWYIRGERCTPCPPTPPPFCSLPPYGCINPEITFPDKMTPSDTLKYMKRVSQDFKRKLCLPIFYRTLSTLELSFQNHPVSTQNITFCKSYWLKEW